jgi:hypothetical protein
VRRVGGNADTASLRRNYSIFKPARCMIGVQVRDLRPQVRGGLLGRTAHRLDTEGKQLSLISGPETALAISPLN